MHKAAYALLSISGNLGWTSTTQRHQQLIKTAEYKVNSSNTFETLAQSNQAQP